MNPARDIAVQDAVIESEYLDAGPEQSLAITAPITGDVVLFLKAARLHLRLVLSRDERAVRPGKRHGVLCENRSCRAERAKKKQNKFIHDRSRRRLSS